MRHLSLILGLVVLTTFPLHAQVDFAGHEFQLNGDAMLDGTELRLTDSSQGQTSSAFITTPFPVTDDVSFEASFTLQMGGGTGADGICFVVQNDPDGVAAIGGGGNFMGYLGTLPVSRIIRSFGVEFDTFLGGPDPDGNHVGYTENGVEQSIVTAQPGFNMANNNPFHAWVDLDGSTQTIDIYVSQTDMKPATPLITHVGVDLPALTNGQQAYIGFTAASGAAAQFHRVLDFEIAYSCTPHIWESDFGPALGMADDETQIFTFGDFDFSFPFAGTTYSGADEFVVSSNGFMSLGGNNGPDCCNVGESNFVSDAFPRIAPLWTDLDPTGSGDVHIQAFNDFGAAGSPNDRLVITWDTVFFDNTLPARAQIQLFRDGTIVFGYDSLELDGVNNPVIVGVTPAGGVADPGEVDLTMLPLDSAAETTVYEFFETGDPTIVDLLCLNVVFFPNGNGGYIVESELAGNDDCADRRTVVEGSFSGMLAEATNDGTATCGNSNNSPDVWYSYTAPADGILTVSTCGTHDASGVDSGMDTVLSLYDACGGTELACNDDSNDCGNAGFVRDSLVTVNVFAGEEIVIRISSFGGNQGGPFHLNVAFEGPPDNDNCPGAVAVAGTSDSGSLANATNDGSASCGNSATNADVWWEFTAASDGVLTVSTCGTHDLPGQDQGMDTVLSLHSACPGDVGNEIACNDDAGGLCGGANTGFFRDSFVSAPVVAGQTVYVRLSHFGSSTPGDYVIQFDLVECDPVENLSCTRSQTLVTLDWNLAQSYDSIEIARDGALVATLEGTATQYEDVVGGAGTYEYSVVGLCFGVATPPETCMVTVSDGTPIFRGDCDGDGSFNGVLDGLKALNFQFIPGTVPPPCLAQCDADSDQSFNGVLDGIYILNFQFIPTAPPIGQPFPCGLEPMGVDSVGQIGCGSATCP